MGAVSERTTVQELPEIKVKKRHPGKIALGIAVASIAAATMAGSCTLLQRFGTNPDNTPGTTPITEPTPTFTPTNTPEITISPSASPIKVSPTPEVSPTLSEHEQLMTTLHNFVEGKDQNGKQFVFPENRFYLFKTDRVPAAINIIDTASINLEAPQVVATCQGYLLGEEEVVDASNVKHLIAYLGFESKSTDPAKKNFYIAINLGRFDTDDKVVLDNEGFIVYNSPNHKDSQRLTVLQAEQELQKDNGKNTVFLLNAFNGDQLKALQQPDQPGYIRKNAELLAQNDVTKALISWLIKTLNAPYQEVPMNSLVKGAVNTPVTDYRDSSMPSIRVIEPYVDPTQ